MEAGPSKVLRRRANAWCLLRRVAQACSAAQGESASLKRDRLMQRNTILRRTGFIEGGQLGPRTSSFLGACGIAPPR